ncbi:MAG TPA: T9SS type A sorting domain-containing protein, partial [Bacteroidales bacterium]|nr:T9SS type A sorting domain-containing protein [Bacteroidales bacterium]
TPTGDVNASFVPENGAKSQSILDYDSEIFVSVNQIVEIPVQLEKATNLGAFTLELSYDDRLIEVLEVVDREIHFINKENSTVKIAWLNDTHNTMQTLAILKVKIKGQLSAGDSYFQLLDGTQLVDESAKVLGGHLLAPTIKTIDANDLENKLVHYIAPNPASGNTNLHYFLPEDGIVRISLFDPTGHEIKKFEAQTLSKGEHLTKITQQDLRGTGLYFYKIDFQTAGSNSTVSGSLLFVK